MYEGDHVMAQLEKLQRTNKLSRLFFLAAMISTSTATLFAQQSPRIDPTKSTTTNVNQKETNNMTQVSTAAATTKAADAIRPFHVNFPEAALVDLRRRI